jgi:hypothetical protein
LLTLAQAKDAVPESVARRLKGGHHVRVLRVLCASLVASLLGFYLVVSGFALAASPLPNPCSLLTTAQVVPTIGGSIQTRTRSGNGLAPTCTWTGPPQGYMQFHETLTLQVFRITRARFDRTNAESRPPATPVFGFGVRAYTSIAGLQEWKGGIAVEMDGRYTSVYPRLALRLAQIALNRAS